MNQTSLFVRQSFKECGKKKTLVLNNCEKEKKNHKISQSQLKDFSPFFFGTMSNRLSQSSGRTVQETTRTGFLDPDTVFEENVIEEIQPEQRLSNGGSVKTKTTTTISTQSRISKPSSGLASMGQAATANTSQRSSARSVQQPKITGSSRASSASAQTSQSSQLSRRASSQMPSQPSFRSSQGIATAASLARQSRKTKAQRLQEAHEHVDAMERAQHSFAPTGNTLGDRIKFLKAMMEFENHLIPALIDEN